MEDVGIVGLAMIVIVIVIVIVIALDLRVTHWKGLDKFNSFLIGMESGSSKNVVK